MTDSEMEVVTSLEELNKLFEHDETRKSILDKFIMPRPGDGGKSVNILYSKKHDSELGAVYVIKNTKFTDGKGVFMMVSEIDNPEVELQMGLGKSLFGSFDRMCNSEGWKLNELPGKIVHITANYYNKISCSHCNGKGCVECENTGNSTVFNVRARHDLMSPLKNIKRNTEEF